VQNAVSERSCEGGWPDGHATEIPTDPGETNS